MSAGRDGRRTSETDRSQHHHAADSPRHQEPTGPVIGGNRPVDRPPSGRIASEVERIETSQAQSPQPALISAPSPPGKSPARPAPIVDDFLGFSRPLRPFAVQAALNGKGFNPSSRPDVDPPATSPQGLAAPPARSESTKIATLASTSSAAGVVQPPPLSTSATASPPPPQQFPDADPPAATQNTSSTARSEPAVVESHAPVYGQSVPAGLETLMRAFEPAPTHQPPGIPDTPSAAPNSQGSIGLGSTGPHTDHLTAASGSIHACTDISEATEAGGGLGAAAGAQRRSSGSLRPTETVVLQGSANMLSTSPAVSRSASLPRHPSTASHSGTVGPTPPALDVSSTLCGTGGNSVAQLPSHTSGTAGTDAVAPGTDVPHAHMRATAPMQPSTSRVQHGACLLYTSPSPRD